MTGPSDPDRRQFFRRFAGEVVRSAVSVVGAVEELRGRSAAEAASLFREEPQPGDAPGVGPGGGGAPGCSPTAVAVAESPPRVGSDGQVIREPAIEPAPEEARGF